MNFIFQKVIIMRRVDNIVESGKYLAIEHVYSCKKHTIYQTYDRQTQETYLTKIITSKDPKIAFYILQHIRNNILPYLVTKKCLREASFLSIPIEAAEVMTKDKGIASQERIEEDQLSQYRTKDLSKLVFLSKKYIPGKTLKEMIQDKSEDLDWKFCYDMVGHLADFVLRFGGIKDLFVTADNIIIGDEGSFYLNYFSVVGMQLVKFDKYIPKSDFQQIFPFLTEQYMNMSEKDRKFNVQIRLNFIILNFLAAFIGSELIFDSKHITFETEVKKSSVMSQITDMQKSYLAQILSKKNVEDLGKFDKEYHVNFSEIVMAVLKRDQKYRNISWKWILERLSRHQKNQQVQKDQKYQNQKKEKKENLRIFTRNFMEIIDHYIQILALLFSNNKEQTDLTQQRHKFQTKMQELDPQFTVPTKENESYLSNRNLQSLIKTSQNLQRQKEFYKQQDWYIQELYIPIKTGMTFTRILQFQNWVHMLSEDTILNIENIAAVLRLLEFILEIEENLSILSSYITEKIMIKTIEENNGDSKRAVKYKYCFNMLIFLNKQEQLLNNSDEDNRSQGYQLNDSQELSSQSDSPKSYTSCLHIFWQQLEITMRQAKALIQKYYMSTTSRQIKTNIRINQQPESQLLLKLGKLLSQSPPYSGISARN